ncbi:hypothetical protein [Pseudomonas fluorescens]|uniref:hypothetical protein n=1 Tax=Pseudomonas fluorescens TaxID=294 RepID=UPI001117A05B|nr:hypothetical protein [Pseudomonas fluorescens]
MKTRITHRLSDQDTSHIIFQTSFGIGKTQWSGPGLKMGEPLDVELDLDEIFSWNRNIFPTHEVTSRISIVGNSTYITAELAHLTGDDCAALKLGNSIILIELDSPLPQQSGFVEIRATTIHLYPTNV